MAGPSGTGDSGDEPPIHELEGDLAAERDQGGQGLVDALALISQFEVLEFTEAVAMDAAHLGGECVRRGSAIGNVDLLIAAAPRQREASVVTGDPDFGRIPGVLVETY